MQNVNFKLVLKTNNIFVTLGATTFAAVDIDFVFA